MPSSPDCCQGVAVVSSREALSQDTRDWQTLELSLPLCRFFVRGEKDTRGFILAVIQDIQLKPWRFGINSGMVRFDTFRPREAPLHTRRRLDSRG